MRESGSKTALMVAAFRGRASVTDPPLCADPWADTLAGTDGAHLADLYGQLNPHATLWMGVRTRFLDDLVKRTEAPQVVILGAGLDTRAARLARSGVRFFEVDHPKTQAIKRERLAALEPEPEQALAEGTPPATDHEQTILPIVAGDLAATASPLLLLTAEEGRDASR